MSKYQEYIAERSDIADEFSIHPDDVEAIFECLPYSREPEMGDVRDLLHTLQYVQPSLTWKGKMA